MGKTGELCEKSAEVLEEERIARLTNMEKIAASMPSGDERSVVERDIVRLQNNEAGFPTVTEAEAKAKGGIAVTRYAVRKMTTIDERFGNFIMAVIAVNVLLMATEHHNQPDGLTTFLAITNLIFCIIFAVEMLLKQFALGMEYFSDNFNCFDCLIVIISFLELAMGGGGLSVLRMLRLVRVFKLVKFLPELQRQFAIMGETLGSVLSFLTLLGLFIFIFAVLGMFIFGGKMTFEEEDDDGTIYYVTSRKNFDTLLWALVTIFQTLTLEDWNAGMYEAVRGTGTQLAAVYYILLIMTGNYIMFNLFVAILIDGFGSDDSSSEKEENEGESVDTLLGNPLEGSTKGRRVSKVEAQEMLASVASKHAQPSKAAEGSGVGSSSGASARRRSRGSSVVHMSNPAFGTGSGVGESGAAAGVPEMETTVVAPEDDAAKPAESSAAKYVPDDEPAKETTTEEGKVADEQDVSPAAEPEQRDLALCCFAPDNALRIKCNALSTHPRFDHFIMTCIVLNSICMAIERPSIQDGSGERIALDILGHIFSFIFSVEMIIKIIALGVFRGRNPYWSNPWNRLDGVIVVISWVDIVLSVAGVSGGMLSILKICRMLRALRPLRAISRLPGLRRIVNVLILSLAPIGTTLIIVGVFFFLFGVLGGQIFSGQFYFCDESDRFIKLNNIKTKQDCLDIVGPNSWLNRPYNFDHLGNSLMTLFVLSSIDGWVEIMYHGVDSAGVDMQPVPNNRELLVFFFILFLLIGGFFIINMFVGVIVENFQKNGAPPPGDGEEPVEEPEPDYDDFEVRENFAPWRLAVLAHATSTCFESSIAVVIILSVVVMGSEHYNPEIASYENDYDGMSDNFHLFLRVTNYIFTIIFVYELVIKYLAFGCKRFHMGSHPRSSANWNNFDFFIVFISLLGILFDDVIGADNMPVNPAIFRILRILRVARILKLLKSAKDLVILLTTVSRSLAQVGNLGLLLFLLFFIYSALGIELFGRLACTDDNPCDGLGEHANFEGFGMAMLTLFRVSTGDNWAGILKDSLREPPLCDSSDDCKTNCCSNRVLSVVFFGSFCLVTQFLLLNIVVAVMMEELEASISEMSQLHEEQRARNSLLKMKLFWIWRGKEGDDKESVLKRVDEERVRLGLGENLEDEETASSNDTHNGSSISKDGAENKTEDDAATKAEDDASPTTRVSTEQMIDEEASQLTCIPSIGSDAGALLSSNMSVASSRGPTTLPSLSSTTLASGGSSVTPDLPASSTSSGSRDVGVAARVNERVRMMDIPT